MLSSKESACQCGDLGLIPVPGRSPGGGLGNPLQYSCLENPMDRGARWATVCEVTKSWTRLSTFAGLREDFCFQVRDEESKARSMRDSYKVIELGGTHTESFTQDSPGPRLMDLPHHHPLHDKMSEVAQSCLTLYHPMDCSLPGSSIHGIFQARVLEWVAISFFRGSSRFRDRIQVSHIAGRHLTV